MTPKKSFRCDAILFDLDGVLVNSAECVERTWRQWATSHHLDPEKVIEAAHGRRTIETLALVAPGLSAESEAAALEADEALTAEGVREVPGARQVLESLPPRAWAIVTSGTRAVARFRIALMKLPEPEVLICAEDIARGKPDPEGYLLAAKRLGLPPDRCMVIEDAPAGIEAAHAAGMPVIAIAATYPATRLRGADAVAARLSDLALIRKGAQLVVDVTPSTRDHAQQ